MQFFISSLPVFMKEDLEFDNPKTMGKVVHKARMCYQQMKQKGYNSKTCSRQKGQKYPQNTKNKKTVNTKNFYRSQQSTLSEKGQQKPWSWNETNHQTEWKIVFWPSSKTTIIVFGLRKNPLH